MPGAVWQRRPMSAVPAKRSLSDAATLDLVSKLAEANAEVRRVTGMLRRVIGEDVSVVTELDPALWPGLADPGQLEQVIVNLAVNARDAMPNGGVLRLSTMNVTGDQLGERVHPDVQPDRYISLVVQDTGTGIDPAVLSKIFDPFVTTKGPGRGTGLGLAVAQDLVIRHGGLIEFESQPGRTQFTILLPIENGHER